MYTCFSRHWAIYILEHVIQLLNAMMLLDRFFSISCDLKNMIQVEIKTLKSFRIDWLYLRFCRLMEIISSGWLLFKLMVKFSLYSSVKWERGKWRGKRELCRSLLRCLFFISLKGLLLEDWGRWRTCPSPCRNSRHIKFLFSTSSYVQGNLYAFFTSN